MKFIKRNITVILCVLAVVALIVGTVGLFQPTQPRQRLGVALPTPTAVVFQGGTANLSSTNVTGALLVTGSANVSGSAYINRLGVGVYPESGITLKAYEEKDISDNGGYIGVFGLKGGMKTISTNFSGYVVGVQGNGTVLAGNTDNWTKTPVGLYGVYAGVTTTSGATGIITGAAAFGAENDIGAATITNLYNFYAENAMGAGTVTNQYGAYIDNLTKGTVKNYGVWVVSNPSYFGGNIETTDNISVGMGTSPGAQVDIKSASTSNYALRAQRSGGATNLGGLYEEGNGDGTLFVFDHTNAASIISSNGAVTLINLPDADPHAVNQLYTDNATGSKVLKVSGG